MLFFFTGAGYSAQAMDYAAHMHIALFHYSLDGRMTPMNAPAEHVSKRPAFSPGKAVKSVPEPGSGASGCGCLLILVGVFVLIGLVIGLGNPSNFQSADGVLGGLGLLVVFVVCLVGGILLMRKGSRTTRKAKGQR